MAISKRVRDYAQHEVFVRENDYYEALAELSLAEKGIKNATPLQIRIEPLFLSHKYIKNSIFLSDLSDQERICLLLTSWGLEVEEIAELLEIKVDSVVKLRAKITQKLNAKNIIHAVYKANQAGILMIDNIDFILKFKHKKINLSPINKESLGSEYALI